VSIRAAILELSGVRERGIVSPLKKRGRIPEATEISGRVQTPKRGRKQGGKIAAPPSELLLELHLESNPEALCVVRATIQRATEVAHFPESDSRAIVRSVDEALANIIRHAYAGRKGLPIELSCSRLGNERDAKTPRGLEIVLKDSGAAPNPKKMKARPLHQVRPGGLGLHFIKESMDVVEFSRKNGKNLLRLVKYLAPSKPEQMQEGE
jgi:anti-sigma regulatory factor (Ser/Thr protein kinase)